MLRDLNPVSDRVLLHLQPKLSHLLSRLECTHIIITTVNSGKSLVLVKLMLSLLHQIELESLIIKIIYHLLLLE
jgi:hypothetical protein